MNGPKTSVLADHGYEFGPGANLGAGRYQERLGLSGSEYRDPRLPVRAQF